jgi:hypothetical protein
MFIFPKIIFMLNGMYDISCALSIAMNVQPLNRIHLDMFINTYDINKYYLMICITLWGLMRMSKIDNLIRLSYMFEVLFFYYYLCIGVAYFDKTIFVIVSSIILGLCVGYK